MSTEKKERVGNDAGPFTIRHIDQEMPDVGDDDRETPDQGPNDDDDETPDEVTGEEKESDDEDDEEEDDDEEPEEP